MSELRSWLAGARTFKELSNGYMESGEVEHPSSLPSGFEDQYVVSVQFDMSGRSSIKFDGFTLTLGPEGGWFLHDTSSR